MVENFLSFLSQGSAAALIAVLVAGLLSVATPCVLPMVSITLGILGVNRAASRGRAVLTSLCYAAGIIVTFTALGIFFGLTGGLFGSYLGHPAVGIAIAAVFLLLAANAFELFTVSLPQPLLKLFSRTGGPGYAGALLAGLAAGFIAAPCIGPVLLGILTFVATTKNALVGALLLATYGLGFALPFIVVGAFALRLPIRGRLLLAVKSLFGLALIAGAFWYLREAIPALREPRAIAVGIVLVIAGLSVGALHRDFRGPWKDGLLKALGILAVSFGGAMLINAAVFTPNSESWCQETPGRECLPRTCAQNDVTVAVFGADWCPWCKKFDSVTLRDPRVVDRLRDFGKVHVDTDANQELAGQHEIQGIPAVVFFDRSGREIGRFAGYVGPDDFLKVLDIVKQAVKPQ